MDVQLLHLTEMAMWVLANSPNGHSMMIGSPGAVARL